MNKRLRLRHPADFARIKREGIVFRHPLVVVSAMPNQLPYNRYGLITSKHLGKAVMRNRVRRLLRESVRSYHNSLKVGYDVVIVGRKGIVGEPFQVVLVTLEKAFKKLALMREAEI